MTHILLIHGWEGSPHGNWFPWLKKELSERGHSVSAPQLPPDHVPTLASWMEVINQETIDNQTILVGHSLGGIASLHTLLSQRTPRVLGAVLVAGFARDIKIPQLTSFLEYPVDFEAVRANACGFRVINSDNDPYVPLEEGEYLAVHLRTPLITAQGKGHLNDAAGVTEYKPILDAILSLMDE